MIRPHKPPAWPGRWLARLLPEALRASVLGDLEEEFRQRARIAGVLAGWLWYWRQVVGLSVCFWRHGIRESVRKQADHRWSKTPRDFKGDGFMATFWQDTRYGLRMLIKHPGFTIVAVVTLALGIGANTAIFSVVNAVLFRPLPYSEPGKLVEVFESSIKTGGRGTVSPANFLDWKEQSRSFEAMAAYAYGIANFSGREAPQRVSYLAVSDGFFQALGVAPLLGRTFLAEEDQPGGNPVVVLSHSLWQRVFGSDPDILNQAIELSAQSYTVVGVMPPGFYFPSEEEEFWVPLALDPNTQNRGGHYLRVVARLQKGAGPQQAESEMKLIAARLAKQFPGTNKDGSAVIVSLRESRVGGVRLVLLVLWAAVGFVALIACANVANLLLTRATAREKEVAIRTALGAGRMRIMRQMVTESLLLTSAGSALGLLLAVWAVPALLRLSGDAIPRTQEIGTDGWVLAFVLGLALATGVLFGLLAAGHASAASLAQSLKEGGRRSAGTGKRGLRNLLIAAEVGMAVVLLVGAGLMVRTLTQLQRIHPGFNPNDVLVFRIVLPEAKYEQPERSVAFFRRVLERLAALPGVRSAGATLLLPMGGSYYYSFTVQGAPPPAAGETPSTQFRAVSPHYFRTMEIPMQTGRVFAPEDDLPAPRVAIVNEAFARQYLPAGSPLGHRLTVGGHGPEPFEIVGVVGNVKQDGLDTGARPILYVPLFQRPFEYMTFALRTSVEPMSLVNSVRHEVLALDSQLPIFRVETLQQYVTESLGQRRFALFLLGLFAALALVLAAVGIYGVISYTVSQRTSEIGIRMALGAQRTDILGLMVGQGMLPVLAGVGVGLLGALALTRFLETFLYEVTPTDPATFAAISLVLMAVAALACYVPARRASRVDPMVALRYE